MFPIMPKADTMVNKTPSMIKRNIVVYFLSQVKDFNDLTIIRIKVILKILRSYIKIAE